MSTPLANDSGAVNREYNRTRLQPNRARLLRGGEDLLLRDALQTLARKLVCGICFTTHITDDAPSASASLANLMHCDAEAVAGRHATADDGSAIRADDHPVIRPPRGRKVERAGADMCLELSRSTRVRKAERLRIHGSTSNENGQATSGPAVLVESGVHIDHQALPQTASLHPKGSNLEEPSMMLRPCPPASTTCGAIPERGSAQAQPKAARRPGFQSVGGSSVPIA
jgi:hypothetical protein